MKSGVRTSEFWIIVLAIMLIGAGIVPIESQYQIVALASVYVGGRSFTKGAVRSRA